MVKGIALAAIGAVAFTGGAPVAQADSQPAHPKRVSEALLPALDQMLVRVFDGPARMESVYCYAATVNGRQQPHVACELEFRHEDARLVDGSEVEGYLTRERCSRIRVYEDTSGCIRVASMSRGTWYYRFSDAGEEG